MTRPKNLTYQDHVDNGQSLYNHGKTFFDNGQYFKTIVSYRHTIQQLETTLGKYHKLTIQSYYRLGQACYLYNLYEQHDDNGHQQRKQKNQQRQGTSSSSQYLGLAYQSFKRCLRLAESTSMCDHTMFEKDIKQFLMDHKKTKNKNEVKVTTPPKNDDKEEPEEEEDYNYAITAITKMLELERSGDSFCKNGKYDNAIKQYQLVLQLEEQVFFLDDDANTKILSNNSISAEHCLDRADILCKIAGAYRRLQQQQSQEKKKNAFLLNKMKKRKQQQQQQQPLQHISLEYYTPALLVYQNVLGNDHPASRGAAADIVAISS